MLGNLSSGDLKTVAATRFQLVDQPYLPRRTLGLV